MNWARQIHLKTPPNSRSCAKRAASMPVSWRPRRQLLQPGVTTADLNAAAEEVLRKHGCILAFQGLWPSALSGLDLHDRSTRNWCTASPARSANCRKAISSRWTAARSSKDMLPTRLHRRGGGDLPSGPDLMDVTEGALHGWHRTDAGRQPHRGCLGCDPAVMWKAVAFMSRANIRVTAWVAQMHEGPQVPNYGTAGTGVRLAPGMTIAIEPMVLVGTARNARLADQWTVVSADGSLTAHFEHYCGRHRRRPPHPDCPVNICRRRSYWTETIKSKYNQVFGCPTAGTRRRKYLMKVSPSIRKRCAKCRIVRRKGSHLYHLRKSKAQAATRIG